MLLVRRVVGESMTPVLQPGRLVLASRFYGRLRAGQVVIIRHQEIEKIKRIASLEDGGLFVVGDNVQGSTDSREFGLVPTSAVIGRVIWPATSRVLPMCGGIAVDKRL